MPRMDGFTFLRILMSRQPTPVIVVSSYCAERERLQGARARRARLRRQARPRRSSPDAHRPPRADPREEMLLDLQLRAARGARPRRSRDPASASFTERDAAAPDSASMRAARVHRAAARRRHRDLDRRAHRAPRDLREDPARCHAALARRAAHARQVHADVRRAPRSQRRRCA